MDQGNRVSRPGNANLPIGAFRDANREIGVPGLKADLQAGADAGRGGHGGSGK